MDRNILNKLIDKVNSGTATDDELGMYNEYLNQALAKSEELDFGTTDRERLLKQQLLESINTEIGIGKVKTMPLWPRIAAAACIIITFMAGGYFLLHRQNKPAYTAAIKTDIPPGTNGAILTLANGQKVVLSKSKLGNIGRQGSAMLKKAGDSSLVYQADAAAGDGAIAYNTLETPRGRQYSVVLPDGTKVWLNAASSITYPTAFGKGDRKVTVTGEAYFEVVHNAKHPFKVETEGQTIEDIGTEFNVNAYKDEPNANTTLVNGKVKVTANAQSVLLKPGQAAVKHADKGLKISTIDVEAAVAWKNGYFVFDKESLESIMRKVARWYNVEVKYTDEKAKSVIYLGSITRFDNISKVLNMLKETSDVRFEISGNTVIVKEK